MSVNLEVSGDRSIQASQSSQITHKEKLKKVYLYATLLLSSIFCVASVSATTPKNTPTAQTHYATLTPSKVESTIEHINNISDVLRHIDGSTAALFDIDVTLIASNDPQGVAGERWLVDFYGKRIDALLKDKKIDQEKFLNSLASKLWWLVEKRPIETDTAEVLKRVQDAAAFTVGFTARGKEIRFTYKLSKVPPLEGHHTAAKQAVEELRDIGIDFSTHSDRFPAEWQEELNEHAGIIFTDGKSKKDFLLDFIAKTGYRPEKIVFVDDGEGNVKGLQKACEELGISYKGFVYDHVLNNNDNQSVYWSFDPAKENHLDTVASCQRIIQIFVENGIFTDAEATQLAGIADGEVLMDEILLLYYKKNDVL